MLELTGIFSVGAQSVVLLEFSEEFCLHKFECNRSSSVFAKCQLRRDTPRLRPRLSEAERWISADGDLAPVGAFAMDKHKGHGAALRNTNAEIRCRVVSIEFLTTRWRSEGFQGEVGNAHS